jgi:hypothetical protein
MTELERGKGRRSISEKVPGPIRKKVPYENEKSAGADTLLPGFRFTTD